MSQAVQRPHWNAYGVFQTRYKIWAIAIYLMTTSLKGVSSMKLHRDLEITQKSAWHLAHRLRTAFENDGVDPPLSALLTPMKPA